MTAGRRGETERNAFERSHEFTSFLKKGNELRGIFSLVSFSSTVCVCVCAYKKARSFVCELCLFFRERRRKND